MATETSKSIRLSCRNLWKVFGDGAERAVSSIGNMRGPDEVIATLKTRGLIPAVCNVSFNVHEGEIFVIMGLSGSGKSTIIRCLSRLIEPTSGSVKVDDKDLLQLSDRELIKMRRNKMGMVFQNFGLLPHMTVLDNVAYPLRVQGLSRKEREQRALKMIELVELNGRENAFPRELSGGMQQRVGIARSLAVEPDVWFLDEPFSALDPLIRRQMQDEFLRLQDVLQKSIVFITHDFLEALRVADRICILRDGHVIQIDTPTNIVLNPADNYVSEFTRDVPRAKVVTAGSIAQPHTGVVDDSHTVSIHTTIEDLLPRLANSNQPLVVLDENTNVVGQVNERNVLRALASDNQ